MLPVRRPFSPDCPGRGDNPRRLRDSPEPVVYTDQAAFARWCAAEGPCRRTGVINVGGLAPLLKAEINWMLHVHAQRQQHEYQRGGAVAYLAAYDVSRARVFGRCAPSTGIAPFMALVEQVMTTEPYASATRVFWIVDNGSSHRGKAATDRLTRRFPNAVLVHTPVHASWLNQVEIYFSVVQRKVVSPNDFTNLHEV